MSMTLATTWVRRGFAAEFPTKYDVDEAELGRIEKLARLQLEDAQEDLHAAQSRDTKEAEDLDGSDDEDEEDGGVSAILTQAEQDPATDDVEDLKEYNLSDYDDEEKVDAHGEKFAMFGNVRSLAYYQPGEEDPYLELPNGEDDSDDEREELQILPTDNLILAAKVEDEVPHLEVFVYEDDADNIYVHHDIMLPAIPLCVEWIDVPVGKDAGKKPSGNFVAVGMMSPEIEVWDLDIVDSMYPSAILGQQADDKQELDDTNGDSSRTGKKKSKKKKKKPKANDQHHVDAVLALALNRQHRNLLASASADKTVKLWDLNTGKCAKSYTMHIGKVTSLDWHPTESTVLLSGSDDRTVIATDMRAPEAEAPKWKVEADVERVKWDVHDANFFFVTTEGGTVHYFDARSVPKDHDTLSKPVWTLQAHDGAVSAFDVNSTVPGFLVTGSDDKTVKLWNVSNNKPSMVVSRNLEVGRIFTTQFAPDPEVAFRLSVAGSRGQVQVWDTSTNASVRNAFAGKVKMPENDAKERMVTLDGGRQEDEESSDEENESRARADGQDGWESMEED